MEIKKILNKFKSSIPNFSLQLIVAGAILTIVFFLLFLDNFKTYSSTVTILVNPKSEIATTQREDIVENIVELSRTLAFYDRMLKLNSEIRDTTAGNSQDKRKQLWNEMLHVESFSEASTVIKLTITAKREADAYKLANITTRTLLDTSGMYYNVKDDLDMRIIDGPITTARIPNGALLFAVSLILGSVVAYLIQATLTLGRKKIIGEKSFFDLRSPGSKVESLEQLYKAEQSQAAYLEKERQQQKKKTTPEEDAFLNKISDKETYPNFPEMPVHSAPKASAPDNLPIAEEISEEEIQQPESADESPKEKEIEKAKEKIEPGKHEPSPEELKERLNQLLRGEL